jgi:hypothetical protein
VCREEGQCNGIGYMWLGWQRLISNMVYNLAVHNNILCRVCVRIVTFCANSISDSYSAIHKIYLDQHTNQHFTPRSTYKPTVLDQCETFQSHLKTVEHIYCHVVSSS